MSRISKTITSPLPLEMAEQLREAIRLYMEEREWQRLHRCGRCPNVRA